MRSTASNDAALTLYQFTWHELCDKYIEYIKPALTEEAGGKASKATLACVLERTLRLLHPIVPFISEEIWQKLPGRKGDSLMIAPWPEPEPEWDDPRAEHVFGYVSGTLGKLGNLRGENNISPGKMISATICAGDQDERNILEQQTAVVLRLGNLKISSLLIRTTTRPKIPRPLSTEIPQSMYPTNICPIPTRRSGGSPSRLNNPPRSSSLSKRSWPTPISSSGRQRRSWKRTAAPWMKRRNLEKKLRKSLSQQIERKD